MFVIFIRESLAHSILLMNRFRIYSVVIYKSRAWVGTNPGFFKTGSVPTFTFSNLFKSRYWTFLKFASTLCRIGLCETCILSISARNYFILSPSLSCTSSRRSIVSESSAIIGGRPYTLVSKVSILPLILPFISSICCQLCSHRSSNSLKPCSRSF